MLPNALFAVLFCNVFIVVSAVASPMVRDASSTTLAYVTL